MFDFVKGTVQKALGQHDAVYDQEWLDTLEGMTDLDAIITVKDQLAKIDFFQVDNLRSVIDLVIETDELNYQRVKRVTYNYLIKLKNNRQVKEDTHAVVYEYQRQLYAAYSQILDVNKAFSKVKLKQAEANLLLARYVNAAFMMAKWRYFDDLPAPHGLWSNVHKVINIAEELSILNTNLFLYRFQLKETSIATLLKRGFMIDTLTKGNYSQLEIELTDRILKIWATNPLIVNTYKPERYHFFIQLEDDKGPERLRFQEKFSNCRYWKTTRLLDLMEAYLCSANMNKPLREFGLQKVARPALIVKLFKKLRVDWCAEGYKRQRRTEQREIKNSLLSVSHGFYAIHRRLHAIQLEKSKAEEADGFTFDLKVATHHINQTATGTKTAHNDSAHGTENWWMVDESKQGFGIDFGVEPVDWVQSGVLVGYTEMGFKNTFTIAEVKSIRKLNNGSYRAGLKKITHDAIAVPIAAVDKSSFSQPVKGFYLDDGSDQINTSEEFPGFLVNQNQQPDQLLMPRDKFKRAGRYRVYQDGEYLSYIAGKVINKNKDWILFEALE